jgi:hypothetical protein
VCPLGFGLPPQPDRDDHLESFTQQPEPQRALQKMMNAAAAGYKALVIISGRNYGHKQESYKLRTTYYTIQDRSQLLVAVIDGMGWEMAKVRAGTHTSLRFEV